MVALLIAFLAASSVQAGKLKFKEAQPIVIDSPGKICVSFTESSIGPSVLACRANASGGCTGQEACAQDPEVKLQVGKREPGTFDPGKKAPGPATGGGPTNGGAAY